MMRIPLLTTIVLSLLVCIGCKHVPSDIIQPDDMAALMADIHTAEAVVDMNSRLYYNDSLRQMLKQSVYARHGVTSEQVDTAFSWYGRNISYYMDVYDKTIEILEHRLIETGNRIAAASAVSVAGDSVDVWPGARFVTIDRRKPSRTLSFSFNSDDNWEEGDRYTWRAKFYNPGDGARWLIGAEYADGTVEFTDAQVRADGWNEIFFQTNRNLRARRLFGYVTAAVKGDAPVRLDSIEVVRKRIDSTSYRRAYVAAIHNFLPPEADADDDIDDDTDDDTDEDN